MLKHQVSCSIRLFLFSALIGISFNVSAQSCGNNIIQTNRGEVCDNTNLGGQSCSSLGFEGGTLACSADCSAFDTSACTSAPPSCGNNVVEFGEVCDGTSLGGQSCTTLGFDGGNLGCAADCSGYVTSFCFTADCGNGLVEGPEVCDGANLNGQSCSDLGFHGGALACTAACGWDTSACTDTPATTGVMIQIEEIKDRLIEIDGGVSKLGDSINELASTRNAVCDRPLSWNRKIPGAERFIPALGTASYCDLETGLVWMETPIPFEFKWAQAVDACRHWEVDGRGGWSLPTVEQLSSLLDSQNIGPGMAALPLGHPFQTITDEAGIVFWTSSLKESLSYVGSSQAVWLVDFGAGAPTFQVLIPPLGGSEWRVWCVRSPEGGPPISEVDLLNEN